MHNPFFRNPTFCGDFATAEARVTVLGMKARNHPQQVAKRGARDDVDTRLTPMRLWRQLDHEFGFTLDAAASIDNAKTAAFFDIEANGLAQSWAGHRVWCNPPFSDIESWVRKAWLEHEAGCELIVMLVPANRTEQPWWQSRVEPHRDRRGPIETRFIGGRINFHAPGSGRERDARKLTSPPFGCVLLIWRRA
jgi:phage N-6-adenine-methyltransferase